MLGQLYAEFMRRSLRLRKYSPCCPVTHVALMNNKDALIDVFC